MALGCSLGLGGTPQNSSALLCSSVGNFNSNLEQICVDVHIIPDTAVPAGTVIDMMCLPTSHTGCVLQLRAGVKSCVPSPY